MKRILTYLIILLFPYLAMAATQTVNTLPAQDSSFFTNIRTFLSEEEADRFALSPAGFIFSGGTIATDSDLTQTVTALTGIGADGHYISQDATALTFTNTRATYVYMDTESSRSPEISATGGTSCTFLARSTRLIQIECTASSGEPVPSVALVPLARVTTAGGAITAVIDLRATRYRPGSVNQYADITSAITAISSTARKLVINRNIILSSTVTVPNTLEREIADGAIVYFGTSGALVINGPFSAPVTQVFNTGDVPTFGMDNGTSEFRPEWWGAVADNAGEAVSGETDSSTAIQNACTAAAASDKGRIVRFSSGRYFANADLSDKDCNLVGDGYIHTVLRMYANSNPIIKIVNSSQSQSGSITGIRFDGRDSNGSASTTNDCVQLSKMDQFEIHRSYFTSCRYGLFLDNDARMMQIIGNVFGSNNQRGLMMDPGASYNRIIGNWFDENLAYGIYMDDADYNVISGNNFLDNTTNHIRITSDAEENLITGNHFRAGGTYGTDAISRILGGDNNVFSNNYIMDHTTEFTIDAGVTSTRLILNHYEDSTPEITDNGTTTVRVHILGEQFQNEGGSEAAPGYSFTADPDSGFRCASNECVVTTGSTVAIRARSTQRVDFTNSIRLGGIAFASLPSPANGEVVYCSDCATTSNADNTCVGSGNGALAVRLNGVWRCFINQNTP